MVRIAGCVVVLLLGLAGGTAQATSPDSTLLVQVMRRDAGLTCFRAPCATPVAGARVTISRGGGIVARRLTGKDGRLRIVLAPARYTLTVPGLISIPRGERHVLLRAGQSVRLTLLIARSKPTIGSDAPA